MAQRPNARVYRRIVERRADCKLTSLQVVHHKDGNPFNNAPDNLKVMYIGDHTALHNRKRKAHNRHKEFLREMQEHNLQDVSWGRLANIDLSEIA